MRMPWISLALITVMTTCAAAGVLAVKIPPMPEVKTFHTEVLVAKDGQPGVFVAIPDGGEYRELGERLAAAIDQASGARPQVRPASELSPEMIADGSAILLGYFANNPMVARIYDEYLITLDTEFPGDDGYVIRTVHDPLGEGTSFVYLGGSTVPAVTKAVDDFIESLPEGGDIVYPHTVKVVNADGSLPYTPNPDRVEAEIEKARGKNFRAVANILTGAGTGYYLTGNPEEVEIFRGVAPIFREVYRDLGEVGDMRGAIYLINAWDAVEESSVLSDQDRIEISQIMWELTHRFTHTTERTADPGETPTGNDWDARVTADLGRYWHKYYGLDPNNVYSWANERFQKQSRFWRSREDCPGYGGMTMYDVLYYVLPYQLERYWEDGTGRKMADYGMAVMNNMGGHAGFGDTSDTGSIGYWADIFRTAAWKLRDGRYRYAAEHSNGAGSGTNNFFYNDYFQDEIPAEKPDDIMGVHVVPLPDWVYEHRQDVLGTAPDQMDPVLDADPTPPREECFDKITFRHSMNPDDQYLIVGGISHGYHAHPDGNSLIEMTDEDRYCLFDSGYFVPDTIEHNTVVIFRDGLFEPVPRLTGLSHLGDFQNTGMTQTYLDHYNGADWRRNIIWAKKKYFLVLDEIEAQQPGNYGLLAVFRTMDDDEPDVGEDRVRATYRGVPFNIVSASHTPFKLTKTTPPNDVRRAVIESKSADLQAGERMYFRNILYTEGIEDDFTYEIAPAGDNGVIIATPDGYALAAAGPIDPAANVRVDAALCHVTEDGFALTDGQTLSAGQTWFASDIPVDIEIELGETATGIIEADSRAVVRLYAAGDTVTLNGEAVAARVGPDSLEFDVPAGRHTISFTPKAEGISADWAGMYEKARQSHQQALAQLHDRGESGATLQPEWKVENATSKTEVVFRNDAGEPVKNLTNIGEAAAWTEAQRGAGLRKAVDGNFDSYAATPSRLAWTSDLPKDIGLEWNEPVEVGSVEIIYFDRNYAPTMEGQQLQAWDGENWYPIDAEISIRENIGESHYDDPVDASVYTFEPVETSRIRIFITEFEQARTAVREIRAFSEPAHAVDQEVRVPYSTNDMAVMDIDGDGAEKVIAAVGPMVKCISTGGAVVWEKDLGTRALTCDTFDLDADGSGEVIVGGQNHYLYCFDAQGNELWAVQTPSDPFTPDREPMRGAVEIARCADIDGDGDGEIVLGSSNWFAYAYDHEGNLLWTALNWAHDPTSIAFADLDEDKKSALIGTTYNDANLFGPEGDKLSNVHVGYHGAAMSTAAGDMNGDGTQELIAGSRVGGLHLKQYQGDISWAKFMGAEVTAVRLADINADDRDELIAGSKNFYVLVTDAEGNILWNTNVGDSVLDVAVADVRGDDSPEIIVATEGGMVRVLSATGEILATIEVDDNVTRVVAAGGAGDGKRRIVAGADDGYLYGGLQ